MPSLQYTSLVILLWTGNLAHSLGQSLVPSDYDTDRGETLFVEEGETSAPVSPPPPPLNFNVFMGGSTAEEEVQAGRAPNALEILVAIFFFVAAAWLLIAVFYALMALVVLRLRSRGRLDIFEEDFGRFYLCGNRCYIPFGFILRRYVVAFGHDQPSREGRSRSSDYKYIRRSERRDAIEQILLGNQKNSKKRRKGTNNSDLDEEMGLHNVNNDGGTRVHNVGGGDSVDYPDPEPSSTTNSEEPVCSICLAEYDEEDIIFQSSVCDHKFHSECICDWLERRNNTECPCCRQPLVSESDVWEAVKMGRKIKQKQAKRAKKKERRRLHSSKHATEPARDTRRAEEDLSREAERDEERHSGEEHRRQETMDTLNTSDDEGGQSNHALADCDGDSENAQNESIDVHVEVEILVSGTSLNIKSNEETSNTFDRE